MGADVVLMVRLQADEMDSFLLLLEKILARIPFVETVAKVENTRDSNYQHIVAIEDCTAVERCHCSKFRLCSMDKQAFGPGIEVAAAGIVDIEDFADIVATQTVLRAADCINLPAVLGRTLSCVHNQAVSVNFGHDDQLLGCCYRRSKHRMA